MIHIEVKLLVSYSKTVLKITIQNLTLLLVAEVFHITLTANWPVESNILHLADKTSLSIMDCVKLSYQPKK